MMQFISSVRFSYVHVSVELLHDLLLLFITHINLLHVIPEVCVLISGKLFYLEIQSEGELKLHLTYKSHKHILHKHASH